MSGSGNNKLRETTVNCLGDLAGSVGASGLSAGLATLIAGSWVVPPAGAVLSTAGLLSIFLGLRLKKSRAEAVDQAALEAEIKTLFDKSLANDAADSKMLTDVYVGLQVKTRDLRDRLVFLQDTLEEVRIVGNDTNERVRVIEEALDAHPAMTQTLERLIVRRFDELDESLKRQAGTLNKIKDLLVGTPQLRLPVYNMPESSDRIAGTRYTHRANRFVGREVETQKLREWLKDRAPDRPRFRWALLLAGGGAGKSRFGLEMCLDHEASWDVGFLEPESLTRVDWTAWQPDEPTFIVFDYVVAAAKQLGTVLTQLRGRTDLAHPVRLLLLERETDQAWQHTTWGRDLLPEAASSEQSKKCYDVLDPLADDATSSGGLLSASGIRPLGDDHLWGLVEETFHRYHDGGGTLPDREASLGRLRELDGRTRSLYAILLGVYLAEQPDASHTEWTIKDLLDAVVRRERDKFWAPLLAPGGSYQRHNVHERLVALATLCYGLVQTEEIDQLKEARSASMFAALDADPINVVSRHSSMVGQPPSGPIGLHPLTPDPVGEYFLLTLLEDPHFSPSGRTALIRLAWQLDPIATLAVIDRMLRDFPDDVENGPLLRCQPSDPRANVTYAMLQVQVSGRDRKPTPEFIAACEASLQELRMLAVADPSPEISNQLAKGLVNLTNHVGEVGRTDPARLDEAMGLLQELRELRRNDDVPVIREQLAMGLVNLTSHVGEVGRTDPTRLDEAMGLLQELRELRRNDDVP
ncbi:MAG: hypothetical protein AAGI46_16670, partial [Planctomycetota bacterium]